MGKFKDLTNQTFSEIKVLSRDFEKEKDVRSKNKRNKSSYWKCICSCGNEFTTRGANLKNGNTKSCGCLQRKKVSETGISNRKINKWEFVRDIAIGYTNKEEKFTIDLEDYDLVKKYCWRINSEGYVVTNDKEIETGKRITILIHRIIMNPSKYEVVDHKNWDKTNNCKSNLRVCTISQNNVNIKKSKNNKSGYTGVMKTKNNTWVATISFNNHKTYLGAFKNIEDAIIARKRAEEIVHKDFNGELNRKNFLKAFNKYKK